MALLMLLGMTACSGGSPATPAATTSEARLGVSATTVNRLDSKGQVTGRQNNLVWTNLPGGTAKVFIDRHEDTDLQAKSLQIQNHPGERHVNLDSATNTFADTEVHAEFAYKYTVFALDTAGNSIGRGEVKGVKVAAAASVEAPTVTVPSPGVDVPPAQPVKLAWTVPSPAPNYIYVQVVNAFTGNVVAALVLNGDATGANIRAQRSTEAQTESVFTSSDSIPNVKDLLIIRTQGALEEALSYKVQVSAVLCDRLPLTSAKAVTIREGAAVPFSIPAFAAYFQGS